MGIVRRWRAMRTRRPAAAEVGIAVLAGLLVLLVAAWQWGPTADALVRGITLGTWLGFVVWLVARRRRVADERAAAERLALQFTLARELHDTVAGAVAAIGIQAAAARRVLATQPAEAEAALGRIESTSRAANADLRRMLEALRSGEVGPIVDAPGLGALPALAEEQTLGRAGAISVTIEPGVASALDPALDRASYRIAEEAIRNARRHAGPVAVEVRASLDAGDLRLVVANAPGRPGSDGGGSGLGLVGMRERAAVFGGTIEAGPTPDGGFRVEARLPLAGPVPGTGPAS